MDHIKPIFVIGSYRSGTSVLTWAIGQHPNILPLEETNWIYRFSVDLMHQYDLGTADPEHTHLSSLGITKNQFMAFFGEKIYNFIESSKDACLAKGISIALEKRDKQEREEILSKKLTSFELYQLLAPSNFSIMRSVEDPKKRWVDGTPENSHFVYGLNKLFPDAKFIHILRNPKKVAKSLMNFSSVGQSDYEEKKAYQTWRRLVEDSVLAEKAYGCEKVFRVYQEDLESDPSGVLRKCFQFIGEEFHEDCLLPLKVKINSSTYNKEDDYDIEHNLHSPKDYVREAFLFYKEITEPNENKATPCIKSYELLENKFLLYVESQKPQQLEAVSQWAVELEEKNSIQEARIIELEREIQNITKPITLKEYGPSPIKSGIPFNVQPDGSSAIWIKGDNFTKTSMVYLNDFELESSFQDSNTLTAKVDPIFTINPVVYNLYIKDIRTNFVSNGIDFLVH